MDPLEGRKISKKGIINIKYINNIIYPMTRSSRGSQQAVVSIRSAYPAANLPSAERLRSGLRCGDTSDDVSRCIAVSCIGCVSGLKMYRKICIEISLCADAHAVATVSGVSGPDTSDI